MASAQEGMDGDKKKPSQVIIAPDAIKLAAMTVSRITGDARRVLDICRFVFLKVVPYSFLLFFLPRRRAVEVLQPTRGTVKAPHIREVVQSMQNSPTAAFLRDLSFHERLVLASLVTCAKRQGVEEIKWSDVRVFSSFGNRR